MQFKKIERLISIVIFLTVSLSVSFVKPAYSGPLKQKASLTNPLLEYCSFRELRPFKYKVSRLIEQQKKQGLAAEVAVYFRSLTNGLSFGINEKQKFAPASLLKVPIVMGYFKTAEHDQGLLQEKVKYEVRVKDDQPYVKSHSHAEAGKYYTIDEMIRFMIAQSDNNAVVMLVDILDSRDINILTQVYNELGITQDLPGEKDFVSLKDYARLFRVLYNASYLNRAMSEKALQYMVNSVFNKGLADSIPPEITIAHKYGERMNRETGIKQLHDIGIVYYSGNPYLIGVMTRGDNFDNLAKVISEISGLVYKEVDYQYKSWNKETFEFSDEE